MGKHELEDGTIIEVDINGRILKADHASWEPLRVLEMSHIEMKMKSTVPASKQKTLPDSEKVYTSKQATEFQTRSREDERQKRIERIRKRPRTEAVAKQPDKLRFR